MTPRNDILAMTDSDIEIYMRDFDSDQSVTPAHKAQLIDAFDQGREKVLECIEKMDSIYDKPMSLWEQAQLIREMENEQD